MPGYSSKSVAAKLGISQPTQILLINGPDNYLELLEEPPPGTQILKSSRGLIGFVHIFAKQRKELERHLPLLRDQIDRAGTIWVSWPKKSAKVPTDVTEDVIRDVALPLGLVDVKVCAISDVWSGLKLVIRKTERGKR